VVLGVEGWAWSWQSRHFTAWAIPPALFVVFKKNYFEKVLCPVLSVNCKDKTKSFSACK
jgi:hypothetical protein